MFYGISDNRNKIKFIKWKKKIVYHSISTLFKRQYSKDAGPKKRYIKIKMHWKLNTLDSWYTRVILLEKQYPKIGIWNTIN